MNESVTLFAAFMVGLIGNVHCVGMCGGIASAVGVVEGERKALHVLLFNLGRVLTYTLLGALAGTFSYTLLTVMPGLGPVLRIATGLLMIALGLYISQWWMGLTLLERGGAYLWQPIKPIVQQLSGRRGGYLNRLLLGLFWGFLPCGLVYSMLAWALTTASSFHSALLMAAFGVGTLPAMLAAGWLGQAFRARLQHKSVRRVVSLCLIAFGVWTLGSVLLHLYQHQHQHQHNAHTDGYNNHSMAQPAAVEQQGSHAQHADQMTTDNDSETQQQHVH